MYVCTYTQNPHSWWMSWWMQYPHWCAPSPWLHLVCGLILLQIWALRLRKWGADIRIVVGTNVTDQTTTFYMSRSQHATSTETFKEAIVTSRGLVMLHRMSWPPPNTVYIYYIIYIIHIRMNGPWAILIVSSSPKEFRSTSVGQLPIVS